MRKNTFFSEYPLFFVVYNEKYLKTAPAAKGGRVAIQFSAEISVNRATWRIVEYIRFVHEEKQNFCRTAWIFVDFYMRTNKATYTPLVRPSRGMPEDAKYSIYLHHLACQCIHLCLAHRPYFKGLARV